MDVFEAFGIKRLSPSILKTWNDDRGLFFTKKIAEIYEDIGPHGWRGDAIEAGLVASIKGHAAPGMVAKQTFDHRAEEWAKAHDGVFFEDEELLAECERAVNVGLERAIAAWEKCGLGAPTATQQWVETWLPGVGVPIVGKFDFSFGAMGEGTTVDLKTANSIPSQPKDGSLQEPDLSHALQIACYAAGRKEKTASLLYVSVKEYKTEPKKGEERRTHCLITLNEDQIAHYLRAARDTALSIQTTLEAALALTEFKPISARDALAELCRPNMLAQGGGMYSLWKDDFAAKARAAVPAWN